MQPILSFIDFIFSYPTLLLVTLIAVSLIAWQVYEVFVRPALVPRDHIDHFTDLFRREYGSQAYNMACDIEMYAGAQRNFYARAFWRRVRREIRRRERNDKG